MKIPLVDLGWQHRQIAAGLEARLQAVFSRSAYILGDEVREFERRYASFSHVAHCVGVASGTDALELCLRALGVGAGDEVVVPANTFAATAMAVMRIGARPAIVDVDPETQLLRAAEVEARLGDRVRAIVAVDLYGQLPAYEELEPLTARAGVPLIADAAQSQGATRHGRRAGSFGDMAATSFYPGKNLGAYGDAGAVLCDDDDLAARVRRLRNYGGERKYEHSAPGFNSRLDTMQACVLLEKLTLLDRWNAARREAATRYLALLEGAPGIRTLRLLEGGEPAWHLFPVRVAERDRVVARLQQAGIGAGVHYPEPLHLLGALAELGHAPGDFPAAEAACREVLSLPLHPGIEAAEQEEVVQRLLDASSPR